MREDTGTSIIRRKVAGFENVIDYHDYIDCVFKMNQTVSMDVVYILVGSIVKSKGYSQTSSHFLFLIFEFVSTHSFPKTNFSRKESTAKRVLSRQRIGGVGDCSFERFLVSKDKICSLVELVLFSLVLMERFCVAVFEVFCFNFH